jgi:adenosylmethionine-8-amino-7-oxononanoate aminotransferase
MVTGKVFPRSFKTYSPMIVKGDGIYLEDDHGKRYIDGCSGALISNLGHCVPEIIEAVTKQLHKIEFAHSSRWRTEASEDAAREVASMAPEGMNYVWFVCGGSEATESAVKLARQYYVERDGTSTSKAQVIARWNSYHGSTLGTMALGGRMNMRRVFSPLLLDFPKISTHYCYRCPFGAEYPSCKLACARELESTIRRIGPQYISAFIAEPVVGASVGALTPPDEYWSMIRDICDRYDILLIADEVMTGCGRTGVNFCLDHWNVKPDIITIAKGMAAGYVPTGGIIVRDEIAETLRDGSGIFVHGHTYNGNPLSGAATAAVFRYIKQHNLVQNSKVQGERLLAGLKKLSESSPIIGEARGKGLMCGLEIVADKNTRAPFPKQKGAASLVVQECLSNGIVLYPGSGMIDGIEGDNISIAPPLVITSGQIDDIIEKIKGGIALASQKLLS